MTKLHGRVYMSSASFPPWMQSGAPGVRRRMAGRQHAESAHKQPGRRYGPAPKDVPGPAAQSPAPMKTARRIAAYQRQNGRVELTGRQQRQAHRMAKRATHTRAEES